MLGCRLVQELGIELGEGARMLACQAVERWPTTSPGPAGPGGGVGCDVPMPLHSNIGEEDTAAAAVRVRFQIIGNARI